MKNAVISLFVLLPLFAQTGKKTESFWSRLLRVTGISATSGSLRDPGKATSGDVWVARLEQPPVLRRMTQDGGYRSPIFDRDGNLLALRGDDLYRLSAGGARPVRVRAIANAVKLVGVSLDDPGQVMTIVKNAQGLPEAAMFSLATGALTVVPHDEQSSDDRSLLAHLLHWERVYGDTRVYVESSERPGAGDTMVSFTDVCLQRGNEAAINLTNGNGVSSGQPSLSADGRQVAFIRGGR